MSQAPSPPPQHDGPPPGMPPNVFGGIGFVLALIGTGLAMVCFPPLALIALAGTFVSAIGLMRPPRAIAIAGVVVGIAGTIIGIIFLMLASVPGQPGTEAPGGIDAPPGDVGTPSP